MHSACTGRRAARGRRDVPGECRGHTFQGRSVGTAGWEKKHSKDCKTQACFPTPTTNHWWASFVKSAGQNFVAVARLTLYRGGCKVLWRLRLS